MSLLKALPFFPDKANAYGLSIIKRFHSAEQFPHLILLPKRKTDKIAVDPEVVNILKCKFFDN